MEPRAPKYDVAISFLSQDMPVASALADSLNSGLKVFFYPRNQEELAGTDGLESMRQAFVDDTRTTVVLYREQWGKTAWTRVEEAAIKDGCLKYGWNRLFFMSLDVATFPIWLPQTHIAFSYANFPIEQAAGAIKARVQEVGGVIAPTTALTRARLVHAEAEHTRKKERLFGSQRWILENVRPTIDAMFSEIVRLATDISSELGMAIRVGTLSNVCSLTDGRVGVSIRWNQPYTNVMGKLSISRYHNGIILPGENTHYWAGHPPTEMETEVLLPDLSVGEKLCWVTEAKPSESLLTESVADKVVQAFLHVSQQATRGDIDTASEFYREIQSGWQENNH